MQTTRRKRRLRPFRPIRAISRRWCRTIAAGLGLANPYADRGYLICATPRSGSTLLCQLLTSTGVLGNPFEYFNTVGRRAHGHPRYPADPRRQVEIVRTIGATPNGIYGAKILGHQFSAIASHFDLLGDLPGLRIVRLDRRDLLAQAISLARGLQTKQFASTDAAHGAHRYDRALIIDCLKRLEKQRADWDQVIARLNVAPLTFEYHDVVDTPQQAVDRIAVAMGLSLPVTIDPGSITLQVMRDDSSIAWRERFLAETDDVYRHLASG